MLVVDQAEELFTLTNDESERRHVIDLLVTAATEPRGALLVLLTLRADFYDRPLRYIQLGRLVDDAEPGGAAAGAGRAARGNRRAPRRCPTWACASRAIWSATCSSRCSGQAGALPLLQFTLDQLFERRDGHVLTAAAYHELGGVRGALARHAEATYLGLPGAEHRALARALFLRLIEPGASAQDTTRRRAPLAELELADPAADGTAARGGRGVHRGAPADGDGERGHDHAGGEPRGTDPRVGAAGRVARRRRARMCGVQGRLSADAAAWETAGASGR